MDSEWQKKSKKMKCSCRGVEIENWRKLECDIYFSATNRFFDQLNKKDEVP